MSAPRRRIRCRMASKPTRFLSPRSGHRGGWREVRRRRLAHVPGARGGPPASPRRSAIIRPRDRNHRVTRQRWRARARAGNGGPREPAHDQALRSHARTADAGRSGEDKIFRRQPGAQISCDKPLQFNHERAAGAISLTLCFRQSPESSTDYIVPRAETPCPTQSGHRHGQGRGSVAPSIASNRDPRRSPQRKRSQGQLTLVIGNCAAKRLVPPPNREQRR